MNAEKRNAKLLPIRRRTVIGMVVTTVWILFGICVLCTSSLPTALNEWGDAMAGFFAPLAFLWLVIGYMQQGDELRLSTEALHLQATELRNSVEQQSALVDVSRKQLQQELRRIEEERRIRRQSELPVWVLEHVSSTGGGQGGLDFTFRITNSGRAASAVHITWEPTPIAPTSSVSLGHVPSGTQRDTHAILLQNSQYRATISFVDAAGKSGLTRFNVHHIGPGATLFISEFETPIAA